MWTEFKDNEWESHFGAEDRLFHLRLHRVGDRTVTGKNAWKQTVLQNLHVKTGSWL